MRVNFAHIKISPETHSQLKVLAAQQGRSLQDVAEDAIRLYLGPPCKLAKKGAK